MYTGKSCFVVFTVQSYACIINLEIGSVGLSKEHSSSNFRCILGPLMDHFDEFFEALESSTLSGLNRFIFGWSNGVSIALTTAVNGSSHYLFECCSPAL